MKAICIKSIIIVSFLLISYSFAQKAPASSKFLLEQYIKSSNPAMSAALRQTAADSLSILLKKREKETPYTDTASRYLVKDTFQQKETFSAYEKLVRGEIIEPESLLTQLEIFGYSMFNNPFSRSQFSSVQLPVPASYPIGPGDEIILTLWGRLNEEHKMVVDRDGKINIPRFGIEPVAGLTFSTLKNNLIQKMQNIEGVNASVSMGELRSIPIYVIGEVKSPGLYTVNALSDPLGALFACNGPTKMASLRTIQVRRGNELVCTIDLYELLLKGKIDRSVRLEPNDVIFVPLVNKMAAVAGNVRRNAIFEIDSKTTLKDLIINLGGGISPGGWIQQIQIQRIIKNEYQTVLDIVAESETTIPSFSIQDGDVVKIFPVVVVDENVVFLEGNVVRPKKYELKPNMRLSDILNDYSMLLPETYLEYAVVQRLNPPSYLAQLISFNLKNIIENPNDSENILLKSRDRIVIYHRDYFEPDRIVTIDGAVTKPGKYKLLENMRVKDLILEAGGLLDNANTERGELYRRTYHSEKNNLEVQKIEFCVKCAIDNEENSNFLLQKFDRIIIRTQKGWEQEKIVELQGEFVYPGKYVLLKNETLGSLIKRAGGFTTQAYLSAAILTRVAVKASEKSRKDKYANELEEELLNITTQLVSKGDIEEAQSVLEQNMQILQRIKNSTSDGRIIIDLNDPDKYESLVLEDGDMLFVPKNSNTISVIGEVFNPATFRYSELNKNSKHYIELCGGLKPSADRKNIYVIKANGIVVSNSMTNILNYKVQPGDAIIIPKKLHMVAMSKIFFDSIDAIFKIATVAATLATLIITTSR